MENVILPELTQALTLASSEQRYSSGILAIGVGEEEIAFDAAKLGDLATCGMIILKNLDATNFVEVNGESVAAVNTIKLPPGGWCAFHMTSSDNSLFMSADTAACDVQYWVWEA
jgi:hypothetical protein